MYNVIFDPSIICTMNISKHLMNAGNYDLLLLNIILLKINEGPVLSIIISMHFVQNVL